MDDNRGRAHSAQDGDSEKYLIFTLNEETFGLPLSTIKEVIGPTEITSLPNVPSYFKVLINLRGRIISVLDLKSKLNIVTKVASGSNQLSDKKCIVIVDANETVLGIVVDAVDAVAEFKSDQIDRNEENQSKKGGDYIEGVAKTADQNLVILLRLSKVIAIDELTIMKNQQKMRAAA
jgi:purine-binding chemotaxis protein CheW